MQHSELLQLIPRGSDHRKNNHDNGRWVLIMTGPLGRYDYSKVQMCDIREVQRILQYSDIRKGIKQHVGECETTRHHIGKPKSLFPTPETHF